MNHRLYDVIQRRIDELGLSVAEVARHSNIKRNTLETWLTRGTTRLPRPEQLAAIAVAIELPYEALRQAALEHIGYGADADFADLPDEVRVLIAAVKEPDARAQVRYAKAAMRAIEMLKEADQDAEPPAKPKKRTPRKRAE